MLDSSRFTNPDHGANAVSLIDAVYRWCEALKGQGAIEGALGAISGGVGAETATLSRVRHAGGQVAKCASFDRLKPSSPMPRLKRSFAASILGEFMSAARSGTVWLRSTVEVRVDPVLDLFHSRRNLCELAVIPLETGHGVSDFIEFHFKNPLSPNQHALLNLLAQTLSEAWRKRSPGIFVVCVLDEERERRKLSANDLFGQENPARLSRAEYRVCLLLSRGLTMKNICSELSICQSTLRTHLRNIFAKTSTHNLPDLLYLLLRGPNQTSGLEQKQIA